MATRIALVHSFYRSATPSGENAVVLAEADAFRRAGLDVELFAASTDDLRRSPLYELRTAVRVASGAGRSPLRELRAFRPDVVHIHNLFPNLGRRSVRDVDVPVVATVHNFRFACASGDLSRGGDLCTACPDGDRLSGVRHGCYHGSRLATVPVALAIGRGSASDPVLARADRVLCLSDRQRRMLAAGGIDERKLVPWRNFLPDALDPGPTAARRSQRTGAVCVARLTPEKGVVQLVDSWPTDGEVLRVVGDGPLLPAVRRAAAGKPVEVLGRLPRPDVLELLSASRRLVLPSRCAEAAPLTVVEALASGAAVEVTGAADITVPPCATPAEARASFERHHSESAAVARYRDLYLSLVGRDVEARR
jgi:glycosyltransferase involved in cell wall biosynthesis